MMIGIGNSVYLAESAFRGGGWEGWGGGGGGGGGGGVLVQMKMI